MKCSKRELIIAYSMRNLGDWNKTLKDISAEADITDEEIEAVRNLKCKTLVLIDDDYPIAIKKGFKPPFVIYYYGDINLLLDYNHNVSIVGSRDCSVYGVSKTKEIAGGLAEQGFHIVSGLARGIDAIAHQACIEHGGKTIAILGCGIDFCYPEENRNLYEIIKKDHLLMSEFPLSLPPQPYFFPVRNRLIAEASKTLVLTEAKIMSGSSITAHIAMKGNTDIMCVPYQAGNDSLCNRLIQVGAYLVESVDDVVNMMPKY